MATITKQTIRVDLTPGRVYPVLHVSQGDVGLEALEFYVYQNGQPFTIPSEVTAINIDGMTPVGVFSYLCTWTGNVVTAELTATMTAERGIDICELALYDATNNKIGTCNFVIAVEESPYTNAHVSTSDMATIMAAASSAQQYELLAKSWAVGDTGIRTGENTNNSEYWAEISESWAVGDTGKRTGEDTNNSEYWSTISHQYANTISFKTYDTVAQMKADTGLLDGGVCRTLGYYAANDGGGAEYIITENSTFANPDQELDNGLVAEFVYNGSVSLRQCGATGDITQDETSIVQDAIDYVVSKNGGKVVFDAPILINNTVYINPGEDGVAVELCGNENVTAMGGTGMYYSVNNIIRTTAGDIFSVNRDATNHPYYNKQWSKFSARNLQIYVKNPAVNVTAFHCIKDNASIFENLYFYNTYYSICYERYYKNANNENVETYNDYTQIINCHTSQCKYIAYQLHAGDSKSIVNCSCTWCASGIKHGINASNCRNLKVSGFMFGNETNEAATDAAIIRMSNGNLIVDDIYGEYIGMPVVRIEGGSIRINIVYVKFNYPSIVYMSPNSRVDINKLLIVSGERTGTSDIQGSGGVVKIKETNVPLIGSAWTNTVIEQFNTLLVRLYRRTATTVAFANYGNTEGYLGLFSDVAQAGLVNGKIKFGTSFSRGTLVGAGVVSENSATIELKVDKLDSTDGLVFDVKNADGTIATTIPAGFEALVKFYYVPSST